MSYVPEEIIHWNMLGFPDRAFEIAIPFQISIPIILSLKTPSSVLNLIFELATGKPIYFEFFGAITN